MSSLYLTVCCQVACAIQQLLNSSSACRIASLLSNHQLLKSYHMLDLSLGGAVRPWQPAHYEESMQQAPPESGLLLPRAAPYFLLEDQACLPKQPYLGQSSSERKPGSQCSISQPGRSKAVQKLTLHAVGTCS